MEIVQVSYSHLRQVSESVANFLKTEYWWEDDTDFKSGIEDDLGITGLDAFELMEKFVKKYNVDLEGFEFNKYFSPEGVGANPLMIPLLVLLLALFLCKSFLAGMIFLFDRSLSKKVFKFSLTTRFSKIFKSIWPSKLENLTVEDLITTAITGKFTKRETVKFVMLKRDVA